MMKMSNAVSANVGAMTTTEDHAVQPGRGPRMEAVEDEQGVDYLHEHGWNTIFHKSISLGVHRPQYLHREGATLLVLFHDDGMSVRYELPMEVTRLLGQALIASANDASAGVREFDEWKEALDQIGASADADALEAHLKECPCRMSSAARQLRGRIDELRRVASL